MDVIDMNERRHRAADDEIDLAFCPCGEAWFGLRGGPQEAPNGALCMARDGRVTGYMGVLHCVACGRPYAGLVG
jgi:hypothetical protein